MLLKSFLSIGDGISLVSSQERKTKKIRTNCLETIKQRGCRRKQRRNLRCEEKKNKKMAREKKRLLRKKKDIEIFECMRAYREKRKDSWGKPEKILANKERKKNETVYSTYIWSVVFSVLPISRPLVPMTLVWTC